MQDLFVKISGITNLADAQFAVTCGANAIGFIFDESSPNFISHLSAEKIIKKMPEYISKIGTFINADPKFVRDIATHANLSAVELYGNEGADDLVAFHSSVIKAFHITDQFDPIVMRNYIVDAFLLDAVQRENQEKGHKFFWNIALRAKEYGKIILSGGLTPDNIEDAVRFVQPYGIDVNTGVEKKPGLKDTEKIREFIARARNIPLMYDQELDSEEDGE
ncbi:MAG: phosphoribosylanthranilate isomerase [bacterium]